ncbi:hypothetical protein GP486_001742 [Trichoglossum hirsutum]|uniref:RZ-type domain-containing protein n=1 Tax=Trichoglossum hirsutum TaxID=265104 RepID=A0A9P8RST6_9PEZI|nr:hypothetical protein GP486_001742 [Trichoglossum hirsutum]
MAARGHVIAVELEKTAKSRLLIMENAHILAGGSSLTALTNVPHLATAMAKAVRPAKGRATPPAPTPGAAKSVASPARPVRRLVRGHAFTTEREQLPCGHQCPSICGEVCPSKRFCQVCAPANIKESNVDYITGLTYAEVDLNETPVIVPPCGHMMTVENFDGHMAIADHYDISGDGVVLAPKNSVPFSVDDLKNCPMCRAPLRKVNRYNRITKRAQIDEATKKFILWANTGFTPLAESLHERIKQLHTSQAGLDGDRRSRTGDSRNPFRTSAAPALGVTEALGDLIIKGERNDQIFRIRQLEGLNTRYKEILKLRRDIRMFLKRVSEAEQPFGRIYDMVQDIRRRHGIETDFPLDNSILQVNIRLRTTAMLLRCDLAILSDFTKIHLDHHRRHTQPHGWMSSPLKLDLARNREDCLALISECTARKQPMHEIEGRIFFARFVALSRSAPSGKGINPEAMERLVSRAGDELAAAEATCGQTASTRSLRGEIEDAKKMLREETFYSEFTNEEMQAVYAAMAREFRGTGHWYACENDHPFTVAGCGMPMETARCPECSAPIGGLNHQSVAGVRAAADIERSFGAMAI